MKKFSIMAATALVSGLVLAGVDTYEENNVYTLFAPQAVASSSSTTSTPLAVKQTTKGRGLMLLSLYGYGTSATHGASITVQHSGATGGVFTTLGTGYVANVTGTNAGRVYSLEIDNNTISNYLRVLVVSTNGADIAGAVYVSPK